MSEFKPPPPTTPTPREMHPCGAISSKRLESWHVPHESEILARVKQRVYAHYLGQDSTQNLPGWRWSWWLAGGAVAVGLALWMVLSWYRPPTQHQPSTIDVLTYTNTIRHRTIHPTVRHLQPQTLAETLPGQQGEIRVAGKWSLLASHQTKMTLSRPAFSSYNSQHIRLHRGAIQIHVVPGAMKDFVVQAQQMQIKVRGTRFSVEHRPRWLRLEVWEGKVVVESPHQREQWVKRGFGMRVDWHGKTLHYALPPWTQREPAQRWRWVWKQHGMEPAVQYLLDVADSSQYSAVSKEHWLTNATHLARRSRAYAVEYQLQRWMYTHTGRREGRDDKLFQAAQSCRMAYSVLHTDCHQLYQEYVRHFGSINAVYRDTSDYWHSRAQALQAQTAQQSLQQWQDFLVRSTHTYYRVQVERWIQHTQRGHFSALCREMHPQELRNLPQTSWLIRYCR